MNSMFDPTDPLDPLFQEFLFLGAISGSAEVECPHCHPAPLPNPSISTVYRSRSVLAPGCRLAPKIMTSRERITYNRSCKVVRT